MMICNLQILSCIIALSVFKIVSRAGGIILIWSLAHDCKELEPGLKLTSANPLYHLPSLRGRTMKLGDCIVSYLENI